MKKIILPILLLIIAISEINAGNRMFFISRNLNKSIIVYDLQLKDGQLDTKEPLNIYWYNPENNPPTTNKLSLIQRKLAYGYSVVSSNANEAVIKMKALDKRTIRICKRNGKWVAIATINGKECRLSEIYAHCPSRTSCDYIELRGKSTADNKDQKETVKH